MSIRVVSKRQGGTKAVTGESVINIARPSVFGNPFTMKYESQRAEVIKRYRVFLYAHYQAKTDLWAEVEKLAERARNGESLALECWCAPCACHGDVLKEAIEFINKQ